jgi:alpha-methylacyl-CoA racemase
MAGPLAGITVIELLGRGPGPFGAMVLSDLGADVIRVARVDDVDPGDESPEEAMMKGHRKLDLVARGRRSIAIDLKQPEGLEAALRLVEQADVLVEGYRPGVVERLGIGPDVCLERNPRLVYARMTGYGQDGPWKNIPGHDLNYVALAGALHALRRPGAVPAPPLNLLGDYGGGGMLLVIGVLAALVERSISGQGQVVDASMVDGVALLTTQFHGMLAEGFWKLEQPGTNTLDMGSPLYNVYETKDGKFVSICGGEPHFRAEMIKLLELEGDVVERQHDVTTWPAGRERMAELFKQKTRDEWCDLFDGTEVCFAPALNFAEAAQHPHNVARGTFVEVDGVVQPAPAPRFSRTPPEVGGLPVPAGRHTTEILREAGLDDAAIEKLCSTKAVAQASR